MSDSTLDDPRPARDAVRLQRLIDAYRIHGHTDAQLDPLGLTEPEPHEDLHPETHGFSREDYDRRVYCDDAFGLELTTVSEVLAAARAAYCGTVGVEYMHIQDPVERGWIRERFEDAINRPGDAYGHSSDHRTAILERLTAAESFEQFLHKKYVGTKRFGLDGSESTMVALEQIYVSATEHDVEQIVMGMAHRGRLNVLSNFMHKPLRSIFFEFEGGDWTSDQVDGSGDVKYHLGTSSERRIGERSIHLSLTANPSHLEAVDPVVIGRVRAKQTRMDDRSRTRVLPILIHGDAAFAGQGLVDEMLDLSELPGYRVGGTMHVIINNQVGFTTNPVDSRPGHYCTDPAKHIQAPIFHVNGDDPDAVAWAAAMAFEFRQQFRRDVVIDIVCYRRFGHNEGDEPAFTQPRMYACITNHPTTREIYAIKLVEAGVVDEDQVAGLERGWQARLESEFRAAEDHEPSEADWLQGNWTGLSHVKGFDARRGQTPVAREVLVEVGQALGRVGDDFALHPKLERLLAKRTKMLESDEGIDWAMGEALAFGTLLVEGHPVRLSGQDVNRGTFSQRHGSFVDQNSEQRYVPLNHIRPDQARIDLVDSPLSEFAVLGFEYGYTQADPHTLVVWEAQFGDFVNGAQVIIDQFITSAEQKWLRMSGLVMLLPHGYDGMGPEHSSGRLERFLQICAQDNMQVLNCTTPANYFHALRRQIQRDFRKPLVVMTPKSLLRDRRCTSPITDFAEGSSFHRVMYCNEKPGPPEKAKQVVLCSGKIYYELLAEREARGTDEVHFLRLEQLYPVPMEPLAEELAPYRHCHLVWCQEEPRNMGAWDFINEFIEEAAIEAGCEHPRPRYAGRMTAASPATGLLSRHKLEQTAVVADAFEIGKPAVGRVGSRKHRVAELGARAK